LAGPVVAWLAGNAFLWLADAWHGLGYLSLRAHVQWDSGQYLSIAQHGYRLQRCGPHPPGLFRPTDWCGSSAWFPLYPLGLRALHLLGLPYPVAGIVLSEVATLVLLGLVWWLLGSRLTLASGCCLALAAVFPGSVYYHAVFPVSLAAATALGCLALAGRGRWLAAGLTGAASAASYQLSLLLAPVLTASTLVTRTLTARRAVLAGGLVGTGLALVMAVQYADTGHPDAFWKAEATYGTGLHNPLATVGHLMATLPAPVVRGRDWSAATLRAFQTVPRWQFLVAYAVLLLALSVTLTSARLATTTDWLILCYGAVAGLAPLVAGATVSQHRAQALLVPVVVLLRHLPRRAQPVLLVAVAAAAVVAWRIAPLFGYGTII
jgi:hypothetical protein